MNALQSAATRNDVKALATVLDKYPRLMEMHGSVEVLKSAMKSGGLEATRFLLDRGAGLDEVDSHGYTPLLRACSFGYAEIVELLLARGADPTVVTPAGRTALMLASAWPERPGSDHVATIRLLLKDGRVPVNATDYQHQTALRLACYKERSERVRVLVVEGLADHTIPDAKGNTPKDIAMAYGMVAYVRLLQWCGRELKRAYLLSKARAVNEGLENILSAYQKAKASGKTETEGRRAALEVAPVYMKDRMWQVEPLPAVEVVNVRPSWFFQCNLTEQDEERRAVVEHVVGPLQKDLFVELMEGLRQPRKWAEEEELSDESDGGYDEDNEYDDDSDEFGDDMDYFRRDDWAPLARKKL